MELKDLVTEREQLVQLRDEAENGEGGEESTESLDERIDAIDEQIRDFVIEHVDTIERSLGTVVVLGEVVDATWGHNEDGERDGDLAGESGADIVDRLARLVAHVNFDALLKSVLPLVEPFEADADNWGDEEEDEEDFDEDEEDDEDSGED